MSFARLIPFQFNSRDALVLVFTNTTMSPVQNGAPVLAGGGGAYTLAVPYVEADLATLGYCQVGNTVTLVHPNYPVYELTRIANNNWTITAVTFGALVQAPTTLSALAQFATSIDEDLFGWVYVVTAVAANGEESLMSSSLTISGSVHNHPMVLTWVAPASGPAPVSYRIYRAPPASSGNPVGAYGLIGVSTTLQFIDQGADPDFTQQPPVSQTPFGSTGNYPAAVGFWQQRRVFANTNNNPDTVYASQTGRFSNFNVSVPSKDDDAVTFRLVSDTVDAIRHIFAEGTLTVLTEGGEWPVYGDRNGVLTPAAINPRKLSSHGVGLVRPVPALGRLIFPQALGSTILGINDAASAEYMGTTSQDLTVASSHLFDGHQIIDLAWQLESPRVAWFVRDDGVLLGLTFVPDEQLLAWHRHDFDGGIVQAVCVVPEAIGNRIEHRVYCVVGRPNGANIYYTVEAFTSPFYDAVDEEAWFVDAGVQYDGRASLVGANTVSGLAHLNGYNVAVYAFGKITGGVPDDLGYVVANPLRSDLATITVSAGSITLPDSYLRIVVGLPFISDLETLDIDAPDGPTMKTQRMNIGRVGLEVLNSRNLWACGGDLPPDTTPTLDMEPQALSTDADYDTLVSDFVEINVAGQWNTNGRIALRSIDPTPFTILAAVPEGHMANPQQG